MARYKFHPKCKSVLLVEEFDEHDCQPAEPIGAVRCPLCTESVYPANINGWRKHIMDRKCPGNARNPRP